MLSCFVAESLLTFFSVTIIIGTTSKGAAAGFAGIPIGLALTLIHLVCIPIDNTSVNSAHSTGPALSVGTAYAGQLWLFWLAPITEAILAGGPSPHFLPERAVPIETVVIEQQEVA